MTKSNRLLVEIVASHNFQVVFSTPQCLLIYDDNDNKYSCKWKLFYRNTSAPILRIFMSSISHKLNKYGQPGSRGRTGEDPVNADITFGGENNFMLFLYSSLCLIIQWILIIYLFLKRYREIETILSWNFWFDIRQWKLIGRWSSRNRRQGKEQWQYHPKFKTAQSNLLLQIVAESVLNLKKRPFVALKEKKNGERNWNGRGMSINRWST